MSVLISESEAQAPLLLTGRVDAIQAVGDGHDGLDASVWVGLLRPSDSLTPGTALSASFNTDDYADVYFDVSATEAARTGFRQFNASGGLRKIGLTLFGDYELTARWSLGGVAAYSRLRVDAADSPIVKDRGDEAQVFIGVSLKDKVFQALAVTMAQPGEPIDPECRGHFLRCGIFSTGYPYGKTPG